MGTVRLHHFSHPSSPSPARRWAAAPKPYLAGHPFRNRKPCRFPCRPLHPNEQYRSERHGRSLSVMNLYISPADAKNSRVKYCQTPRSTNSGSGSRVEQLQKTIEEPLGRLGPGNPSGSTDSLSAPRRRDRTCHATADWLEEIDTGWIIPLFGVASLQQGAQNVVVELRSGKPSKCFGRAETGPHHGNRHPRRPSSTRSPVSTFFVVHAGLKLPAMMAAPSAQAQHDSGSATSLAALGPEPLSLGTRSAPRPPPLIDLPVRRRRPSGAGSLLVGMLADRGQSIAGRCGCMALLAPHGQDVVAAGLAISRSTRPRPKSESPRRRPARPGAVYGRAITARPPEPGRAQPR